MNNLRDRGYPGSREYVPDKSGKRNALMSNSTPTSVFSGPSYMGQTVSSPNDDKINKLLTAYNNKAFGNPNMPMINRIGFDSVDDNTDERRYLSGYDIRNHEGDRLGFVHRDVMPLSASYYAGIDNLPLGDNYISKDFKTPIGTFSAEYDGDGTASLGYQTSPNVYYMAALAKALMSKGSL